MTTPEASTERRAYKSNRYVEMSRRKIAQAQEELDKGDTIQASEKTYGAVTAAVKACAELRGWNHYSHIRVERSLEQLRDEWDNPSLTQDFRAVKALHINFFEYELGFTAVQDGINTSKTLIERLEAIRNSEPKPLASASLTREQRTRLSLLMQPSDREEIDELPSLDDLLPVGRPDPGAFS